MSLKIQSQKRNCMKKTTGFTIVPVLVTILLAGCCETGPKQTNNADDSITLENALASIGRGLYQMKTNEQGVSTGLLPDTVTVTLNVGASQSQANAVSGGLIVSAPTPVGVNVGANVSGSHSSSQTSQTANTITITFKNILFAGVSTTAGIGGSTSSNSLLPLLKDPATTIQMLTWINTNSFVVITNRNPATRNPGLNLNVE
jgi:hypothetical protein